MWLDGIPQYIKNDVEPRIKTKLMKKPDLPLDGIDVLDFKHYLPIIPEKRNWDRIFSNTFSLVNNIKNHLRT